MPRQYALILAGITLAACSQTLPPPSNTAHRSLAPPDNGIDLGPVVEIDTAIQELAQGAKPLILPAKIGLARLEKGRITALPASELTLWRDTAKTFGPEFGDFVIVNTVTLDDKAGPPAGRLRHIAAQQGLDYIFAYSVETVSDDVSTGLGILDLTLIGGYIIPSKDILAKVTLSGALIDVTTGHIHASLVGHGRNRGTSPTQKRRRKRHAIEQRAKDAAVRELADQAAQTLKDLAAHQQSSNHKSK